MSKQSKEHAAPDQIHKNMCKWAGRQMRRVNNMMVWVLDVGHVGVMLNGGPYHLDHKGQVVRLFEKVTVTLDAPKADWTRNFTFTDLEDAARRLKSQVDTIEGCDDCKGKGVIRGLHEFYTCDCLLSI